MRKAKSELLLAIQRSMAGRKNEISRREFLSFTGKASALIALPSIISSCKFGSNLKPEIAILGAGIAGLTAAHYLSRQGINATIYEALPYAGGRMQTAVNKVNSNITSEIGGEFIDSNHEEILTLVKEFGLELKDHSIDPLNKPATKETYFIDGKRYNIKEVVSAFNEFAPRIEEDQKPLGNYDNEHTAALDKLSIAAYFDKIGINGWLRKLLEAAYKAEFGAECEEQSCLNFLSMISPDTSEDFNVFGDSDERFGIKGGNNSLPRKMAEKYAAQIQYGKLTEAITQKGKAYHILFTDGKEIKADHVICTIPFSVLKDIPLKIENLSPEKVNAIQNLGYGNNAKLILGLNERPWRVRNGAAGYIINESIHNGWDSSNMQNQNNGAGAYTIYTSAQHALDLARQMKDPQNAVNDYLPKLDLIFPGCAKAYNGKALIANWPEVPTIKGAYSYFKTGQWTSISGNESTPSENFFYAGEHCSADFQGYMNGGAQTGKDAALAVLKTLKITT